MPRFTRLILTSLMFVASCASFGYAQGQFQETGETYYRYLGGTMAWWKLGLIAVLFVVWVKLADWINLDAHACQERTGIKPIYINPIVVGCFLLGFGAVLFVPFFLAGFPFFLLGCIAPFIIYVAVRNSRMPDHMSAFTTRHLGSKVGGERPLVDDANIDEEWPPIRLEAAGSPNEAQINQIRARQASDWTILRSLLYNAISTRTDMLVGKRNAQGGQWRKRIDGVWHSLVPMEPAMAEGSYTALKYLAGIPHGDKQAQLAGGFTAQVGRPIRCDMNLVRDATSETVQIRFFEPKVARLPLADLGLFPEVLAKLTAAINASGLVIISSRPGEGLSTTWNAVLNAGDRVTKDWVALVDENEVETQVENIEQYRYDLRKHQSPVEILPSILLKQPEVFVVPKFENSESMSALLDQVQREHRSVITRTVAGSAPAALLKFMKAAPDRRALIDSVTAVTCQRLVRRLCDRCKQPMPTTPDMIQKLGGDPKHPPTVYRQYSPPDPPPVDKKGNPIEIPPCEKCAGVGYYGRVALMEVILMDDVVRRGLDQQPDEVTITNLALIQRGRSAMQQGFRHILAGTTSLAEIQRVFKQSK